jgi:hypothetical protein
MERHHHHDNHWCANAWVGAPWACGHHSKENFEVDALDMYGNNTNHIIENYSTDCKETKCVNYCSQIGDNKVCEQSVEAGRSVDPDDKLTYPSTVKRCKWDSDNKICQASEDICNIVDQGTEGSGYPCSTYYTAACARYNYTKKCNKYDGNQDKCDKHFSQQGDNLHRCMWLGNTRQCKNTGNDCKEYAYCPKKYGCY